MEDKMKNRVIRTTLGTILTLTLLGCGEGENSNTPLQTITNEDIDKVPDISQQPESNVDSNLQIPAIIPSGHTKLLIGQTFWNEFDDYIEGIGTAPAGSSHYAELYTGQINQGHDGVQMDANGDPLLNSDGTVITLSDNYETPFLDHMYREYPNATVMIAISIKDNPAAGGYSGRNAGYKAIKAINQGMWDQKIDLLATKFKDYPQMTFMVRIGYEVSLLALANVEDAEFCEVLDFYNSQGINIFDDISVVDGDNKIDYKAYHNAYNRIADRIRNVNHATNVKFLYHPVRGFGEVKTLYPGDQYVDYIAFSVFNHDIGMGTDETFDDPNQTLTIRSIGIGGWTLDDNLRQSLDWSRDIINKPIIIAESAYQNAPPEWKDYIDSPYNNPMIEYLERLTSLVNTYDIRALTYINSDWQSHGWPKQWADSRVEIQQETKNYWIDHVINNSRFMQYE